MIQIAHVDPRIPYYMNVRLTVALWCPYDGGQEGYKENRFQNASDAFKREAKHDLQNKQAKW